MTLWRFRKFYHPPNTSMDKLKRRELARFSSWQFRTFSFSFSNICVSPAIKCLLGSGCMSGMLDYCVHLAWTQASGAWSIHCSTWVKVIESSPSPLRSPMSKHMVMEHLEHVWVTRATWPELPQQKKQRRWRRFRLTLLKQNKDKEGVRGCQPQWSSFTSCSQTGKPMWSHPTRRSWEKLQTFELAPCFCWYKYV